MVGQAAIERPEVVLEPQRTDVRIDVESFLVLVPDLRVGIARAEAGPVGQVDVEVHAGIHQESVVANIGSNIQVGHGQATVVSVARAEFEGKRVVGRSSLGRLGGRREHRAGRDGQHGSQ